MPDVELSVFEAKTMDETIDIRAVKVKILNVDIVSLVTFYPYWQSLLMLQHRLDSSRSIFFWRAQC